MRFNLGDYLADTMHLSTLQHGIFFRLLMHCAVHGELPKEERTVARIARMSVARWRRHAAAVLELFRDGRPLLAMGDSSSMRTARLREARQRGTHTPEQWEQLLAACEYRCLRCDAGDEPLTKDHVQPIFFGGSDAIDNLQPLCGVCNSAKGLNSTDYRPTGWRDI
jgi:5-methylcytosine-specific restriction endonuclease McrA